MKKIGILTYWWSIDNYGQLLQAYALQSYLKSLGHDTFFIKYKPEGKRNVITTVLKILNLKKLFNYIKGLLLGEKNNRRFDSFREKHLFFSEEEYKTLDNLRINPPRADIYVCGSDQIWNRATVLQLSPYLLNFGDVKKISYAASFGKKYNEIPQEQHKIFLESFSDFSGISVREESGIEVCEKLGYKSSVWLPDPTLLLDKEDYLKLSSKLDATKMEKGRPKQILIYTIGNVTVDYKNKLIRYLSNLSGYKVTHVSSQKDFSGNAFPTISEWLNLVNTSDFVLTNSFHGMVFSIIFKKEFAVMPCAGKHEGMNERIFSLLKRVNLEHKILDEFDEINRLLKDKSNWDVVHRKVSDWKLEAEKFIEKHLE